MKSPQRAKWDTHIEAARSSLKRLEDERIAFAERQKRTKEQIVWELAQKLEEDGMPREWILGEVIRALNGYGVTDRHIRRVLKKGQYDLVEESTSGTRTMSEVDDKNNPEQKTVTIDAATGEEVYQPAPPPPRLAQEVKRLRTLLEEKDKEHKATKELVATLQEAQNIDDMPELVDNKIGPVEIKNLSKINQFDRRGYQILASRFAELIKRKLQAESKAAIKFYVLGKDRTTNIEYMVPVSFIVDFTNKTTDLILDETRP
jgi:hypothetical protein